MINSGANARSGMVVREERKGERDFDAQDCDDVTFWEQPGVSLLREFFSIRERHHPQATLLLDHTALLLPLCLLFLPFPHLVQCSFTLFADDASPPLLSSAAAEFSALLVALVFTGCSLQLPSLICAAFSVKYIVLTASEPRRTLPSSLKSAAL
jgi:hypothetical protein